MDVSERVSLLMQHHVEFRRPQGLTTPKEVKQMNVVPYVSVVGSIMYAVRCIRPDVAFLRNLTSRFQNNPDESHSTTWKNILKYLRKTKEMFLVYDGSNEELSVKCYTDAGFENDKDGTK
ncbi:hypothetical protein Tco_0077538 [Tanacetum coccineum]